MSRTASPPIIADPALRELHDGQVYLVLRPGEPLQQLFRELQARLRPRLVGLAAQYPNEAHVTMRGYPRHADRATIRRVAEDWGRRVPPLAIQSETMHAFEPPTQAIVLQVAKTPALRAAFSSLRECSEAAGLPFFEHAPRFSADDWIFHISLVYCDALGPDEWARVRAEALSLDVPDVTCVVDTAELVWYDDGVEHVEVVRLVGTEGD